MAQVINPWAQITGLSASGQTDDTGTWNTSVSLVSLGVPATASAALIYVDVRVLAYWYGLRDPTDTTAKSKVMSDGATGSITSHIVPLDSGTVDIYVENTTNVTFYVAGYWEEGAIEWFSAGNELTRSTTDSGAFSWDFTSDDANATGIIINNTVQAGDTMNARASWATNGSPTSYSNLVRENTSASSEIINYIVPLDGGQACYGTTASLTNPTTYNIVGLVKQKIDFLYDDNGGPTESPTSATWTAGGYDYGAVAGIGCLITDVAASIGYLASADTSAPVTAPTAAPNTTAYMHTVKSDGTFNYLIESGTPSYDVFWFMGPTSKVYINDAATLDGGEVEQTYPGAANWSDTSIDMQTVPDKGALTGQLYVLVELPNGSVASRAVTIGEANTELSMGGIIVLP